MRQSRTKNDILIICDLDNTLYDWYSYFVPSIYALIQTASQILKCDESVLIEDLKLVHRRHHDSEHPFALLETEIVRQMFRDAEPEQVLATLDPAFHAFNKARRDHLSLFDGVLDTLMELVGRGIPIVAHTESKTYGAVDRLNRLQLAPYLIRVYCREESPSNHPDPEIRKNWLKEFPWQKIRRLPVDALKPNPAILRDICNLESVRPEDVIYIGDSVAKDIWMAKQAGCFAVWAEYGARPAPPLYEKLVRLSHWTATDVARESAMREQASTVQPDFICRTGFRELIEALEVAGGTRRAAGE